MKPGSSQLSLFDEAVSDERATPKAHAEGEMKAPTQPVVPSRPQSHPSVRSVEAALLTTREAAELLHVHPRTVQRLVERGELAAVHVGDCRPLRAERDLADLTARLKSSRGPTPRRPGGSHARPRRARVSFAERLRSQTR